MLQGPEQSETDLIQSPALTPVSVDPNRVEDLAAIGWLSTSILHDLRNPASAICAAAELLIAMEALPTDAKRLARSIYRAAGRVQELLTDLTSVIRGNGSTFELCELHDLIAAALEAATEELGTKGVQVGLDMSRGIVLALQRSRMQRVFFNLISNAIEALSHGGELRITANITGDCVNVVLEDTGPGIPPEIRDRLFEPFVTTGKDGGWGLGLTLSRQAILDHGGEIWTEPAAGSRFVVRLPLSRGSSSEEMACTRDERSALQWL